MDFGEILDQWDKLNASEQLNAGEQQARTAGATEISSPLNEVYDKGERRFRLLRKNPEASIDLHGFTHSEAWAALEAFFENSRRKGFEKILVIHGKGNHRTEKEGVLKELTRRFIESCSFAGESGHSSAREGGTGSTWVILKETAYRSR